VSDAQQDAVVSQLAEMRERLLRDAAVAGTAERAVTTAIDEIADEYANARVTTFVAVLVEREVRARLNLQSQTPNGTA
jgi:hypothetical protein